MTEYIFENSKNRKYVRENVGVWIKRISNIKRK